MYIKINKAKCKSGENVLLRPFSTHAKRAALASSKYLNSQSAIKMELSAQADCATNFLQPIKLQESFFLSQSKTAFIPHNRTKSLFTLQESP